MADSIIDITHNHGREMYILALQHAVNTLEMLPAEQALTMLKEKVETERKELEDERAQQIQRRALS